MTMSLIGTLPAGATSTRDWTRLPDGRLHCDPWTPCGFAR
jgi:hypothetical protein